MNRRAELLSQKANELQAYLEETQKIEELTSRKKTDELVEDFEELGGYLEKRARRQGMPEKRSGSSGYAGGF